MNLLFRGLASRLLLSKRKVKEEDTVISVTEPLLLTNADSGKTYSLDSAIARLDIPLRATLTTGWNITVKTTVPEYARYATVTGGEVGVLLVNFEGDVWDGIALIDSDALATITFNGASFDAVAIAGTVNGYYD